MRIVIDMQGAQTGSRLRGIGRYVMNLVPAMVRQSGGHEILLVLSGLLPESIEHIRSVFQYLLPQENIRVWHSLSPVREADPENAYRQHVAELAREAFICELQPDVILVSSLFEGYGDDAVTSIGLFDKDTPVCVILYDLIPLVNSATYLDSNPIFAGYYCGKLAHLKRARHLLAISDFTRQEAVCQLQMPAALITNISSATDDRFFERKYSDRPLIDISTKIGIGGRFILYTGGSDERKNLPRLIQAFASLPLKLKSQYQLVIAGHMPDSSLAELTSVVIDQGLNLDLVVFTGYISDDDLIELYRSCSLYVFPSWHEGFGLPALEAMACGSPVIGANTSSLPEVIGLEDALFDPFDVGSIAAKIEQALLDDTFRAQLRAHGLSRAKDFSWDTTAKRAIEALESIASAPATGFIERSGRHLRLYDELAPFLVNQNKSVMTSVSLCLAQNQQSSFDKQLLVDVSELCQRDAATGVQRVVRSYLKFLLECPPVGYRVEPVFATKNNGYCYARKFTLQFLGEDSDQGLDTPVRWQRGDIFFGLDMQHHVQLAQHNFYQKLRHEGVTVKFLIYDLLPIQLVDYFRDTQAAELHAKLLAMIAKTDGAICISRATSVAYGDWLRDNHIKTSPRFQNDWVHIGADIDAVRKSEQSTAVTESVLSQLRRRTTFLCVSTLEPRKGQKQILEAFDLLWCDSCDVNLVFVGQQGWKVDDFITKLDNHPQRDERLFWLKGVSDGELERIYSVSSCLIAASINEGFGLSIIEGARYGLPIIARDIPVFREVAGKGALYFRGNTAEDLSKAIEHWMKLAETGRCPDSSQVSWMTWEQSTENLKQVLCGSNASVKQILVDVSELVQRDAKTGIQRVVRSVLAAWFNEPPAGWQIEPVYVTTDGCYRYARKFISELFGDFGCQGSDMPIEFSPGDIFFALDYQPQVQIAQASFYQYLRQQGVTVKFMLYDMLSVSLPSCFPSGSSDMHSSWLTVVAETDGVICISRAVADEMRAWMSARSFQRQRAFSVEWTHLGADIGIAVSSKGLPYGSDSLIDKLSSTSNFLMVGTLEPRKAHAQVLQAFERLWADGDQSRLIIVGKVGWMVEELVQYIKTHPENGKRLYWLDSISDEYLEKVYEVSSCLIAASLGEGFGLPLIEAAQHNLPIIARDIPVFREVAGEGAFYFTGNDPHCLSKAISNWLALLQAWQHPKPTDISWLTWAECVQDLGEKLVLANKLE